MDDVKEKLRKIDIEIRVWMADKAEPNLVDVERKSHRYKLKWESINMFERNERLNALRKQRAIVAARKN
jgi:hypothetical protein